jgi:hypothetical protein
MSIFKSTFSPSVKAQLEVRQKAMTNRTPKNISYLNSRNAWIRMSSSVNVNGKADLAKKYVLQGGTLNNVEKSFVSASLKSGLGSSFDNTYSNIGNVAKTPYQRGIRPMPGITGMDIKSKSAYGSLREVTINFQCWDIQQLEELEVLYMRPGYTALVEWGWTPYLDNKGEYQPNFTDYYDIIHSDQKDRTKLFKDLYDKSVKYGGNYDAMFGYVKNYQWSARPDGGYDCQTTIISTGEIIESLKVNYLYPTKVEKPDQGLLNKEFTAGTGGRWIDAYKKNILSGIWAETFWKLHPTTDQKVTQDSIFNGKYITPKISYATATNTNNADSLQAGSDYPVYITLEAMCDVLNKYIIAKSKADSKPLVELSVYSNEYDEGGKKDLLCTAHPLQLSVDPSVCLIKSPLWYDGEKSEVIQDTQASIAADTNYQTALSASLLIQKGYQGGTFDGTYEDDLLAGVKLITNKDILAFVDQYFLPEDKQFKDGYGYNSLEEVLNGELGGDDLDTANEIKISLEKIAGVTVTVTPTYSYSQAEYSTTDVDTIKITVTPPLNKVSAAPQATIQAKATQAIDSLEFIKDIELDYFYNKDPYSELGVIKNIYVNVDFLYQQALSSPLEAGDTKEKNEINLYNYLKSIISAIQTALGNVSNFEIHVDPIDNKIARIIDVNYTEPDKSVYNKLFELQVHNLNSVVRSYSLQSQIFPNQSSIIAIGAQAKGGQLGMQTNTMIDFNRNLEDRIIPEKVDGVNSNLTVNNNVPSITNGLAQIINAFAAFKKTSVSSDDKPDYNGLISEAKNALRDLIVYIQSITSSSGSNRNLIPTKFSCEMDGIGGLVIGHMFKLPKNILPKGYRGENVGSQLGNAITSIGHSISNGDWITKIDTLNIVLDDPKGTEFRKLDLTTLKTILVEASSTTSTTDTDKKTSRAYKDFTQYPYKQTPVDKNAVIAYIRTTRWPLAVKRGFYASFAIESAYGASGINNNINGMQTDGGKWRYSDEYIIGTTTKPENKTGNVRSFAVYESWQKCADHVMKIFNDRIQNSGNSLQMIPSNPNDTEYFANGYCKNWIGNSDEIDTVRSVYESAKKLFPK